MQQDVRDELSQEGKPHLRQDTHTHTHEHDRQTDRQKQTGEQWKDEREEETQGEHWEITDHSSNTESVNRLLVLQTSSVH